MSEIASAATLPDKLSASEALIFLPGEDREAQVLWKLRTRVARSHLRHVLTTSRLRTALVLSLTSFFWAGLFLLFYEGFEFVVQHVGRAGDVLHARTIRFVFHLFFASLNVMLVFSAGIILYSGLYTSPETKFLLTLPVRSERIVLYKFQEALLFSSWGFFLLASPMMMAYGIVNGAQWHYYALVLPLILSFVYIPCALGSIGCLWILYKLPRLRNVIVGSVAGVIIVVCSRVIWQTLNARDTSLFGSEWFQETLQRFRFTQLEWLPSSWLTGGLLEAARSTPVPYSSGGSPDLPVLWSVLYLVLLISNALMLHLGLVWSAKRWFRAGYDRLSSYPAARRKAGMAPIDRVAASLVRPFPHHLRLLLLKDWRLLRRDPAQWSQFLIFLGLLGLYFLNVDRFHNPRSQFGYITWVSMISFLNLAVVGLILSTFTTRFIYPMISLEGQCFWVLGLMPVRRSTIVWSKFLFALLGSLIPCALLILLSDLMLNVPAIVVIVHQLTCVLLCMGLSAIAVGLGAAMPNFAERSPSKIAAGFGGTLNLVFSALYILVIVVLTALPCHFYHLSQTTAVRSVWIDKYNMPFWLALGAGTAVCVGAATTVILLSWGLKSFRDLEGC